MQATNQLSGDDIGCGVRCLERELMWQVLASIVIAELGLSQGSVATRQRPALCLLPRAEEANKNGAMPVKGAQQLVCTPFCEGDTLEDHLVSSVQQRTRTGKGATGNEAWIYRRPVVVVIGAIED